MKYNDPANAVEIRPSTAQQPIFDSKSPKNKKTLEEILDKIGKNKSSQMIMRDNNGNFVNPTDNILAAKGLKTTIIQDIVIIYLIYQKSY